MGLMFRHSTAAQSGWEELSKLKCTAAVLSPTIRCRPEGVWFLSLKLQSSERTQLYLVETMEPMAASYTSTVVLPGSIPVNSVAIRRQMEQLSEQLVQQILRPISLRQDASLMQTSQVAVATVAGVSMLPRTPEALLPILLSRIPVAATVLRSLSPRVLLERGVTYMR